MMVVMISGCGFAQVACSARTPQQALSSGSIATANPPASDSSVSFYRLARIVVDPELHRRWALIANCSHPERPLAIIALSGHVAAPGVEPQSIPLGPFHAESVSRGLPIKTGDRPITSLLATLPSKLPAGTSKTSLQDPSAVAPVIRAGDLVRLWSSNDNVRLEMAVIALEYGRVGQVIHVRRMGQSTLLAGVVVGRDSAELLP